MRTPQIDVLAKAVAAAGGTATAKGDGSLLVQGLSTDRTGDIAFEAGVRLHELSQTRASLEQAFMELTADSVEYHAGNEPGQAATGARHAAAPDGPALAQTTGDTTQPADTAQARTGRMN